MAAFLAILEDIGLSFITIFVAIDAVGILPFILSLTQDITPNERSKVVQYALITAFVLGLVFIAIGRGVFFLLGIEMADFMVAGG